MIAAEFKVIGDSKFAVTHKDKDKSLPIRCDLARDLAHFPLISGAFGPTQTNMGSFRLIWAHFDACWAHVGLILGSYIRVQNGCSGRLFSFKSRSVTLRRTRLSFVHHR